MFRTCSDTNDNLNKTLTLMYADLLNWDKQCSLTRIIVYRDTPCRQQFDGNEWKS